MCTLSITIRDELSSKREALYQTYLEASHDVQREEELKEWDILSTESWEHDK